MPQRSAYGKGVKRRLLVILELLAITLAAAQDAPKPAPPPLPPEREFSPIPANWPAVEYAEVRAYLYNPGENRKNLILHEGKLHPEVANPEGIKLDAAQIERLLATLRNKAANGVGVGCFEPHHGFVFYDRDGKPVADLTVCFLCIQGVARPGQYRMTTWEWDLLKQLVRDLGLPVFKDDEEAEAHFIDLAKQWPDARVKAAVDKYIFSQPEEFALQDFSLLKLLESLGERTHPFLLAYLADKEHRADWLKRDPAKSFSSSRFGRLCTVLGDAPPPAAIPLLEPFFNEADATTRRIAIEKIASTGAPEIVPFVRKALAESNKEISTWTVSGLLSALNRGALNADTKAQLFPDVKEIEGSIDQQQWAEALIGLDSNKARELFLSPETFKAASPRLGDILAALCETKSQVPRELLLSLVAQLRTPSFEDEQRRMELALLLLGRQRNPADLELLRGTGDENFARHAMPGLLAWHGLEGYRDRISKLEEEKGIAALNKTQRQYVAAAQFGKDWFTFYGYFLGPKAEHWQDARAGLKAMKCDKQVTLLEEARALFGKNGPSSDDEERWTQVESLGDGAFDDLSDQLREASDSLDLSLDRFAIEHAESFK
jgi:hypothetical protein